MRQASDRLSVRRYVGYDLGESLPDPGLVNSVSEKKEGRISFW